MINQRLKRLDEQVNKYFHTTGITRVKRGVFNFVGDIAKILFGTLSDSDARYYNDEIDKLYHQSSETAETIKEFTKITKATINAASQDIHTLFKVFAEQQNKLDTQQNDLIISNSFNHNLYDNLGTQRRR